MMDVDAENDFNREMQAHDAHELAVREYEGHDRGAIGALVDTRRRA